MTKVFPDKFVVCPGIELKHIDLVIREMGSKLQVSEDYLFGCVGEYLLIKIELETDTQTPVVSVGGVTVNRCRDLSEAREMILRSLDKVYIGLKSNIKSI